ncbi:hypothetical protein Pelo_17561 [Pelomyxa schiedti]|nr:hypothetical protein Pelo_17561 [Pelomyxa schiedti]
MCRAARMFSTHNARAQLHALAMASHRRCGAQSPARYYMSLPPLATSPLWEWCLRDSAVSFSLFAELPQPHNDILQFTLSSALNSPISCALKKTNCGTGTLHGWSSIDHIVMTQHGFPVSVDRVVVLDLETGCESSLWDSAIVGTPLIALNTKWVVECGREGRNLRVLNLDETFRLRNNGQGVELMLPWPNELEYLKLVGRGAFFNRSRVDEVVLAFESEEQLFLVMLDLKDTYVRKKPVVLQLVKWKKLIHVSTFRSGIVMRKSATGQCVMFAEMWCLGSATVFEFQGGCVAPRPISSLATLIEASVEIWDCNNTAAPLRVMEALAVNTPKIGESGFLFNKKDTNIDVTDSHGNAVMGFEVF